MGNRIAMRAGHPGFGRQGIKRLTEWAAIVNTAPTALAANSFSLLTSLTGADLSPIIPSTLVRIRGQIMMQSDQDTTHEAQIGSLGIAIVQDVARAAGGASLPDPFLDAGDDTWLYWTSLMSAGERGAGTVVGSVPFSVDLDAKSMRKIVDGDALIVMLANHNPTTGIFVAFQARFLFLLH